MQLGRVTGQVVSTARCPEMPHNSLLVVELLNGDGNSTGEQIVVADPIGAGESEWVIITRGSSARTPFGIGVPIDATIVGIVDHVNCGAEAVYRKNQS